MQGIRSNLETSCGKSIWKTGGIIGGGGGGLGIDELKTGKKNPQEKHYQTSERTRDGIIDENAKGVNITERLRDIDKRQDELLELLDSLQTLYGENNRQESLAVSESDEADIMIRDCVDNETKGARLFYRKVTAREAKQNFNNMSKRGTL